MSAFVRGLAVECNTALRPVSRLSSSAEHQHSSSHSGRSGVAPAFMPATPQQPLPAGMGYLLDEEEDYVIIEGISPFSSAHGTM